jgi:hypothetical protein
MAGNSAFSDEAVALLKELLSSQRVRSYKHFAPNGARGLSDVKRR